MIFIVIRMRKIYGHIKGNKGSRMVAIVIADL